MPFKSYSGLEPAHQKALAAKGSRDEQTVRVLVDAVIDSSILGPSAARSLRDRVCRSEHGYRHGTHVGITESAIVAAINDASALPSAPPSVSTSPLQVHTQRMFIEYRYPAFATSATNRTGPMSPVETLVVASMLLYQKVYNPCYYMAPDDWDAACCKRRSAGSDTGRKTAGTQSVHVVPGDIAHLYRQLRSGIGDESGDVVWVAHRFLDRLSFLP